MNWSDIASTVGKAAPMLGTLIAGPAGAAVGSLVASALGTSNTPEAVSTALQDPASMVKLREIEAEKAIRLQELLVDHAKTEIQTAAADRADARKMQTATRSRMPAVLAVLITSGFFGSLAYLLHYGKPEAGGDALMIMLGALGTAWTACISYYYGTTSGSARKTEMLGGVR